MPQDPLKIYEAVYNGKRSGPIDEFDVERRLAASCNVVFDTTKGEMHICHRYEEGVKRISLTEKTVLRAAGPVYRTHPRILQIMAEHPGRIFTVDLLAPHLGYVLVPGTLKKYIVAIRNLLGDRFSRFPLIKTTRYVDDRISPNGAGYLADPASSWLVIRYHADSFLSQYRVEE